MEFNKIQELVSAHKLIGNSIKKINRKIKDTNHKICTKCEILLDVSKFTKSSNTPIGYKGKCKNCVSNKNKNYYNKTKDEMVTCECGLKIKHSNRYEHKKSQKHLRRMDILRN